MAGVLIAFGALRVFGVFVVGGTVVLLELAVADVDVDAAAGVVDVEATFGFSSNSGRRYRVLLSNLGWR